MYFQIMIAFTLLLAIPGLFLWFFKKRKSLNLIHNEHVFDLKNTISNHDFQIDFRNTNLDKYDFLQFNLNEVLTVQPKIQINC